MKMIFKKATIGVVGLMASMAAFAQDIHVKVINQTKEDGEYSMKIGDGADFSKKIAALKTLSFNYDVKARNPTSDVGIYQFFSLNLNGGKGCASVVAHDHEASKIVHEHYRSLVVTIGDKKNDCAIDLQYS
jgi:hypothetical protein